MEKFKLLFWRIMRLETRSVLIYIFPAFSSCRIRSHRKKRGAFNWKAARSSRIWSDALMNEWTKYFWTKVWQHLTKSKLKVLFGTVVNEQKDPVKIHFNASFFWILTNQKNQTKQTKKESTEFRKIMFTPNFLNESFTSFFCL